MLDHLDEELEAADRHLAKAKAILRTREMTAFHGPHDAEGYVWAGKVDELQHIRDMISRLPFVTL